MGLKVLFISHYAGRTGAPIMLLNMLRWFKENTDLSFEILLRGGGELQSDFEEIAPTRCFCSPSPVRRGFFTRMMHKVGLINEENRVKKDFDLLEHYQESNIELIYSNTITNGEILDFLSPLNCQVITHVHELNYWIEESGSINLKFVKQYTSHYVAAAHAVKINLIENVAIEPENIDVVHEFIPIMSQLPTYEKHQVIRCKLGISEGCFVVVGSGHETWRKGKDLFVLLAYITNKLSKGRPIYFVWVGCSETSTDARNSMHDVNKLGLSRIVHFVGGVSNPLDYFAAGDVFAMTSREDPYPLVCLEAASVGKPVLCFADAGGMPEFVEQDAGCILPYLDIYAMADEIVSLSENPERCLSLGMRAAEKVRERHSIDVGGAQVLEIIRRFNKSETRVNSKF